MNISSARAITRLNSPRLRTAHLKSICPFMTSSKDNNSKKGLVLGAYSDGDVVRLTPSAQKVDAASNGRLQKLLSVAGPELKKGKGYVFYDVIPNVSAVALVGLGKAGVGYNETEGVDDDKEAVRVAAAVGCSSLKNANIKNIAVEDLGDAKSAAEGAALSTWIYNEYKTKKEAGPSVRLFDDIENKGDSVNEQWNTGIILAEAQNFARKLTETPANLMTPTIFAEITKTELGRCGVDVLVHDEEWARNKKMGSFLSVTRGSIEPPKFVEITYSKGQNKKGPIVLVGKGITFDAGGISLKPSKGMESMRGDMGGAACVVAAIQAAAKLNLNLNIKGLIPLCENLPSGSATKPGDVVTAMNGKSIQVDNTDAEGRLILADALCYADEFNPSITIDIATLTGSVRIALGTAATGVFTNSTPMWTEIEKAGIITGDRMWRLPLWDHFTKLMTEQGSVDVNNVGGEGHGGACKAAAFLKEFAPRNHWMHLDIAGVSENSSIKYLGKGMTGRPTRTLVQFLAQQASQQ